MQVTQGNEIITIPERDIVEKLPDTGRYKRRFKIYSETTNTKYLIAYDSASGAGYWKCSCRGNIRHGRCKHLTNLGLLTRYDVTVKRLG